MMSCPEYKVSTKIWPLRSHFSMFPTYTPSPLGTVSLPSDLLFFPDFCV